MSIKTMTAGRIGDAEVETRSRAIPPSQDIGPALRRAAAAQLAGRPAEAEQICRTVLAIDPKQPDALFLLAGVAAAGGRSAATVRILQRAIAADPRRPEFHGNLGTILSRLGRIDEAIACFSEAIRLDPASAAGHIAVGNLLHERHDLNAAIESFRRAITLEPVSAVAHFNLGNALKTTGRLGDAVACFREAIRLRPNLAEAHLNLGVALFAQNRLSEAEAALRTARQLRPDNPLPVRQLALVLIAAKRLVEASALLLEQVRQQRRVGARAGRNVASFRTTSRTKLRHDADQLSYLGRHQRILPALAQVTADYETALTRLGGEADETVDVASVGPAALVAHHNRLLHFRDTPTRAEGALGHDWEGAAVEAAFHSRRPGFAWFDGLLAPAALQDLRQFCLESTVWFQMTFKNEVSATLFNGFCCPLLLQIAIELRERLPGLLATQPLALAWAYKYCGDFSGLGIHADDGTVSVNFWVTPDEANLEPERGGLVLWDREVPESYLGRDRAEQQRITREIVDAPGTTAFTVPYRCNRAVVFKSMTAHSTDQFRFEDGYENRRINITLLYGHAG